MQGWLDAIFCSISPENPVAACTTQGIEIQSMLHDGRKEGISICFLSQNGVKILLVYMYSTIHIRTVSSENLSSALQFGDREEHASYV